MNKAELIEALAPYPDDSEVWFECVHKFYPITGVEGHNIDDSITLTTNED